jgi:hypothetical protein
LNTINAIRECLSDLGWETQYNDISVSGGFSAMSTGEGTSPDCAPCSLLFTLGSTSYLEVDLCTWVSTTALSGAGRINYSVGTQNTTNNLKFYVDDIVHTVTVTGNKDMLYFEIAATGITYVYRMLIVRLNDQMAGSGVATAPVVVGQPIQLRTGDASKFKAGGSYCALSHPRGGVREGYYQSFSVTSVDTVNDTIATTLTGAMGTGSVLGGNPFPWVGINIHGYSNQVAISFVLPAANYTAAGSNANVSGSTQWTTYLRPSSIRNTPGAMAASDKMAHGRRMIYPVFYGDLDAGYGGSEYLKMALGGANGDFFGVNERGSFTVSTSTSTTITCNDASWETNEHIGAVVFFNGGAIDGARAAVESNTGDTLTLDVALESLPAQGDGFILFEAFYQIAIMSSAVYMSYFPALAIKAV